MDTFRMVPFNTSACWGDASGMNVWDQNDPTLYGSGTHTGSSGVTVLTDSSKSWTTNQWTNLTDGAYMVKNLTSGVASEIVSNTGNTVSCASSSLTFNRGDSYQIHKIISLLDGPGRGKGSYISGGNDSTAPTPTAWPNDALEPVRVWNNTLVDRGNGLPLAYSQSAVVRQNREFYVSTDSSAALAGYTPYAYPHPLVSG